jgi:hypothetical protein
VIEKIARELLKFGTVTKTRLVAEHNQQMGGKVFDLSPIHQAMIAEAVIRAYPTHLCVKVQELLVSGKYRPSESPYFQGMTLEKLREVRREKHRKYNALRTSRKTAKI